MAQRPGTPRLLRQINDRAALELLLTQGPLTRAELGELTGLSKVTSGQLLSRLEDRGLVRTAGERAGGRGPNAALYTVNPTSAYVAGLEVLPDRVTAGVADITGQTVAEVTVDPTEADDPVRIVHNAVRRACETADVALSQLRSFVIGTRGVVDPRSGDVRYSFDLPAWHMGVLAELRTSLGKPVRIENDVNLAALAEQAYGAAAGQDDFAILWAGVGQGLGVMLGGRLHRGITGGAGEIGWLPVPGEPLPTDVTEPQSGSFQRLVGGQALTGLAADHGLAGVNVDVDVA
ncbi:ROK family transcriptional regulator, partial [Acrocarpospora catenulata]|uniref:ROK family transcriptional regulator n=1 Tax=Acrocarpospora catenulata TaxID=2836182 RepID=UPI001BD9FED6